ILLIQRQLTEQRKERLAALRRFELIAEMNHHIRNALQTISYQRYTDTDPAASQRLKEAVERIQWVLEEIWPVVQKREGSQEHGNPRMGNLILWTAFTAVVWLG